MTPSLRLVAVLLVAGLGTACASAPPPASLASPEATVVPAAAPAALGATRRISPTQRTRETVVRTSLDMIGAPYRYGGRTPRGFDCSGLVTYSYGEAGVAGLPHSAAALASLARPIPLAQLAPGDLLFFELEGKRKTSHVGIYVGDRAFVHAPSPGKRVERVSFDHVYWSRKLGRAGRILDR